jgi:hypothetical protein
LLEKQALHSVHIVERADLIRGFNTPKMNTWIIEEELESLEAPKQTRASI